MGEQIERIRKAIEPLRQEIMNHKVYTIIKDIGDLKTFMQYHVFAVWDFMSLLKILQNNLTCTSVPWFPKGDADTRFLINEIVVGEESDIDMDGKRTSHFELYLTAMEQCNADVSQIHKFISVLQEAGNLSLALDACNAPQAVRDFVGFTFQIISSNKDWLQSAIFTFGREDLIPGMFLSIVSDINKNFPNNISIFKYYLDRHIEVDGGHHSQLALQMTENLCNQKHSETNWQEAEQASIQSLQMRIHLWDGIYEHLSAKHKSHVSINP